MNPNNHKISLFCILFLLFGMEGYSQLIEPQCQLSLDYSKLVKVFGDEFDNPSISDHLIKWDTLYYWGPWLSDESFYWCPVYTCIHDNTHVINNGKLHLKIKRASQPFLQNTVGFPWYASNRLSYKEFYYSAGMIRSKYNEPGIGNPLHTGFRYGIIEAKFKFPISGIDKYPCLWLTTSDANFDIIINEHYSGNSNFSSYAVYPNQNQCQWSNLHGGPFCPSNQSVLLPYHIDDKFHTFHLVWTPERISWFFDGRMYRSIESPFDLAGTPCRNDFLKLDLICDMEYIHWCSDGKNHCENSDIQTLPSDIDLGNDDSNPNDIIIDYIRLYKPINNDWTNFTYTTDGYHNSINDTYAGGISSTLVSNTSIASSFSNNVYFIGSDKGLWNIWLSNNQWVTNRLDWNAPNDVAGDLLFNPNLDRVYYRSNNNKLEYCEYNGTSWSHHSDGVVSNIEGASDIDLLSNKIYYRGTDKNIWQYYPINNQYNTSQITSFGNVSNSIKVSPDGSHIFYRGGDGYLWVCEWNGSIWTNIQITLASNVYGDIGVESNDRVYYVGNDLKIWNWDGIGNYIAPLNIDAMYCNGKIAVNDRGIFYSGIDTRIWHLFWIKDQWLYEPLEWSQQNATGQLISDKTGDKLFYIGMDFRQLGVSNTQFTFPTIYEINIGNCNDPIDPCIANDFDKPLPMNINNNFYKTNMISTKTVDTINKIIISNSLNVIPNPAYSSADIYLNISTQSQTNIEIYDLMWRKVETIVKDRVYKQGTYNIPLYLTEYPEGMYYIVATIDSEKLTSKLIKY